MTELLTAAQMRAIEQAAIASCDVTGLELMERAGQGVVDAIFAEWPELAPGASDARGPAPAPPGYLEPKEQRVRRAIVLCGPGNNGGDGIVVARLLAERDWHIDVLFYGAFEKLPADAQATYLACAPLCEITPLTADWVHRHVQPDLLVDALFGIGLSRPLPEEVVDGFADLLKYPVPWRERSKFGAGKTTRCVAVDIPSGICADSGVTLMPKDWDLEDDNAQGWPRFMARAFSANLTVTFQNAKVGHYSGISISSQKLKVALLRRLPRVDAALRVAAIPEPRVKLVEPVLLGRRQHYHQLISDIKKISTHKYNHGHALILSGSMGKGGAARLAARGALRIGAGVVTVGCPPSAILEHATQLSAIMTRKVADAAALTDVLADARINALCIGPGLGLGDSQEALVRAAIPDLGSERHVVLDADALTLISRGPDLVGKLNENCVLTPHAGEFARLFPDIAEKLKAPATLGPAYSKVDATREAAMRAGCIVLYKGPDTVIAHPDGRCSINAALYDRTAPWLATAGSGDVLAGFITGLLARGHSPMEAAETGAWLHVECARSFGPGLIAEDLPEELPKVFRTLDM